MFVAGYDTDVIERWGRWKSSSFATYLWNDDMDLAGVGRGMMMATGLLNQLKRQSEDDRNREVRPNRGRAGGKGNRGRSSDRVYRISKKLSQICRHDAHVYRQRNGFVEMSEVMTNADMRALGATREEVHRIVHGDGGNYKMRFELGVMDNGKAAIRTSQGHSIHAGVSSGYLGERGNPGRVVRGASLSDAVSICESGLGRMDRVHIHLGRTIKDGRGERPGGIRNHTEVGIVFDGTECRQRGVVFRRSANGVILTEGLDGVLPGDLVVRAFAIRDGRNLFTRTEGWLNPPWK